MIHPLRTIVQIRFKNKVSKLKEVIMFFAFCFNDSFIDKIQIYDFLLSKATKEQ